MDGGMFSTLQCSLESNRYVQRMKAAGQDIMKPVFRSEPDPKLSISLPTSDTPAEVSLVNPEVKRHITAEELKAQPKDRPWVRCCSLSLIHSNSTILDQFVVNGEVYDGTAYLKDHPGGADSIIMVAGDDATEDFMSIHSIDAKIKLREVRNILLMCTWVSIHDVHSFTSAPWWTAFQPKDLAAPSRLHALSAS